MTETVGGGGRRLFIALADTDGDRDIIQDGTNSIIAANSQLETGSIPTSYISTLGAQATRAADTWTADLPDTSQTVSIQMGGLLSYADTGLARELGFYLLQDAANEYIEAYLNTAGSNTGTLVFRTQAAASGLTQVSQAGYLTPGINQPFNVASRHTATVIGGASDGTYIYTNTPTVFPSVGDTDLQIGFPGFNGYIRQLLVWADDIGAAGTAEATA
jgi:hypothetical protein